jgi:Cysteine-rich CWC
MARAFVRDGYRGVTVCVDASRLGAEWSNREMDAAFFAALPAAVDPGGEHGEFHSFAYDGPGFTYPVRFARRKTKTRGGYHHASLAALSGDTCARCGAAFECGMKAGRERCWCVDAPRVPIDPSLEGCLCPRCLALEAMSADRRSNLLWAYRPNGKAGDYPFGLSASGKGRVRSGGAIWGEPRASEATRNHRAGGIRRNASVRLGPRADQN